jgi:hypothetical protein
MYFKSMTHRANCMLLHSINNHVLDGCSSNAQQFTNPEADTFIITILK